MIARNPNIDEVSKNKLLGAYTIDDQKLDDKNEKKLIKLIKNKKSKKKRNYLFQRID